MVKRTIELEGVTYTRYVVRFRLADGRRCRWVRYLCPIGITSQVGRELAERFGLEGIAPRSVTLTVDN